VNPLVVEPYPIRVLAADCPITIVFRHSRLVIFHTYVVVYSAIRVFQQFKGTHCNITTTMNYVEISFIDNVSFGLGCLSILLIVDLSRLSATDASFIDA
jgi:hypothetical protein